MKKLFLLLLPVTVFLAGIYQPLQAQEETRACKLFCLELLGPGITVSANYIARFKSSEKLGLGYRLGIGYGVEKFEDKLGTFLREEEPDFAYLFKAQNTVYSIPAGINWVFGKPSGMSLFEIGAGVTFLTKKVSLYNYEVEKRGHVIGFLSFMYRLAPVNGGMELRAGFTPVIGTAGDFFPMGTVGFGYTF